MVDSLEQIAQRVGHFTKLYNGPCGLCGKDTVLGPYKMYCDECVEQHIAKEAEHERRREWLEVYNVAYKRGLCKEDLKDVRINPVLCKQDAQGWKKIREWESKRTTRNLFVTGTIGSGKTHSCRWLLTKAPLGCTFAEVTARRALDMGASRLGDDKASWRYILETGIVLLDDIDKVNYTENLCSALWELLDARSCKTTLITSQMNNEGLMNYLRSACRNNESIAISAMDRIKPVTVVEFKGESLR